MDTALLSKPSRRPQRAVDSLVLLVGDGELALLVDGLR